MSRVPANNKPIHHSTVENSLRIEKYRVIQQYLVDRGVNQPSARDIAANDLSNWPLLEIERIFSQVTKSDANLNSLETTWLHAVSDAIANITTSEIYWTKAPADLLERSAKEGLALCISKEGKFSLQNSGYFCVSHVWEEGIRADAEQNRGIPTHRIKQIFERISHLKAEWIWLDGLAIPSGSRSLTFKEEEQKTAIINSLADIYEKCEAVVIFDALTMHLHSEDPIETAVVMVCGKWMTRVWTWQEVKMTHKALVVTATSTVDWSDMFEALRIQARIGPSPQFNREARGSAADKKFYNLFMSIARLTRNDEVGLSLADIVSASRTRMTGNDIDYARAFFPALRLRWRTGTSREEAMKTIYDSQRADSTRLVLKHGSPRSTYFPGWAPSYFHGLEGTVLAPIPYESRGIRRKWWTTKIKESLPCAKPRALLLSLVSLALTQDSPLCGCELSEGETQATMEGIAKAIKAGNAYLLSDEPLHPIVEWAKHAMLVERVELDHGDEAYVFLTVAVTVMQEKAMAWETEWLLRHESPISDHDTSGRFFSQLRIDLGHDRTHGKHQLITAAHNGDEKTVEALMNNEAETSDRD